MRQSEFYKITVDEKSTLNVEPNFWTSTGFW